MPVLFVPVLFVPVLFVLMGIGLLGRTALGGARAAHDSVIDMAMPRMAVGRGFD